MSKLATMTLLFMLCPTSDASHVPSSPHVPQWKDGDAIVFVDRISLPEVTGAVEMLRSEDPPHNPESAAFGIYVRQTHASGRHTYFISTIGSPIMRNDFLRFTPTDGISPSWTTWLNPDGLVETPAGSFIKSEHERPDESH